MKNIILSLLVFTALVFSTFLYSDYKDDPYISELEREAMIERAREAVAKSKAARIEAEKKSEKDRVPAGVEDDKKWDKEFNNIFKE